MLQFHAPLPNEQNNITLNFYFIRATLKGCPQVLLAVLTVYISSLTAP